MEHYKAKSFDFHELTGISQKTMDTHLGLYSGYVNNTNQVFDLIESLKGDDSKKYALLEARRRFSFEFDGMRNHEYFFEQFTGGAKELDNEGELAKKASEQFGSLEAWHEDLVSLTGMRGVGWVVCYYDTESGRLVNSWVDEQHLGHLNGAKFIFGIDMWEHAFMLDYEMSEKSDYVKAVMENTNWDIAESRFKAIKK